MAISKSFLSVPFRSRLVNSNSGCVSMADSAMRLIGTNQTIFSPPRSARPLFTFNTTNPNFNRNNSRISHFRFLQVGTISAPLIQKEYSGFRSSNYGRQSRSGYKLYYAGLIGTAGFGLLAYVYYNGLRNWNYGAAFPIPVVNAAKLLDIAEEGGKSPKAQLNFIADVVEKVSPAVVFIDAVGKLPFFGEQAITSGSGFIVRSDGYILTNAHVVEGVRGRKLRVHLQNGTIYEGYVTYMDTTGDLALVRINAKDLPALALGDSSKSRPGEWVIAVGSPFSLTNSVTMGIISSTQRRGADLGLPNTVNYIQTDALITFGNSGGPLVNLDGEAIGINSMKVTDGISFAIPSDYAKNFLVECAELEEQAKDRSSSWLFGKKQGQHSELVRPGRGRPRVGIVMMQLDEQTTTAIRSHDPSFPDITKGILVHTVVIGQPAFESGIRPGDVITHANGKEVNTTKDLLDAVESSQRLKLRVVRKSRVYEIDVEPAVDDS